MKTHGLRCILVVAGCLFVSLTAAGQHFATYEKVYMKDGRVFSGHITELIIDSIVSIRENKTYTYTVRYFDVKKITKDIREGISKFEQPRTLIAHKDTLSKINTWKPD